jgi:hypothetical protein
LVRPRAADTGDPCRMGVETATTLARVHDLAALYGDQE